MVQKSLQTAHRLSSKCYSTRKPATPDEIHRISPSSFRRPVVSAQLLEGVKENFSIYPGETFSSLLSQKDFFHIEFKYADLLVKHQVSDFRITKLAHFIINRKAGAAWRLYKELFESDPQLLVGLSRSLLSKFMSIFDTSAVSARKSIIRLKHLADFVKSAGHELQASDYTTLISCAFKSHNYDLVEKYWIEAESSGITKTTALYNSYMQAACNAYPKFWSIWRFNRDSPRRRFLPGLSNNISTPYAHVNAISILQLMHRDEVPTNARTYELVLLYYAQIGELDKVRSVIKEIWKIDSFKNDTTPIIISEGRPLKGDLLYPTISTLRSVVSAFSFNDCVSEGVYYMTMLQRNYNISLLNKLGADVFTELFKWAYHTTEPNRGSTPKETFHKLWDLATVGYQITPSIEMYYWWVRRTLSDEQYDRALAEIPRIASIENSGNKNIKLIALIVSRVARSYSLEGELEKSADLLQTSLHWGPELEDTREKVEEWMEVNQVTRANLRERQRMMKDLDSDITYNPGSAALNELNESEHEQHIVTHSNTSTA